MNRPTCKAESRHNSDDLEHRHWYCDPHRERTKFKRLASRARRRHLKDRLRKDDPA